jgi:signal peptidase I
LLDEAERIQRKNRSAVERALTSDSRSELSEALEDLRDSMNHSAFDERLFLERYERASRLVSKHLGAWQKGELREYMESIGVAVGVAFLLRAGVVEAFKIPSGSMLPTLQIQDHIFVNKLAYGPPIPFTNMRLFSRLPPKRGDVMVFEYPEPNPAADHPDYIKRVIAVAGDRLEVEHGRPRINGWLVPNCPVGKYAFEDSPEGTGQLFVEYLGEYSYLTIYADGRDDGRQGPYDVAPGETWVMGDNRNNSSDSRAWDMGRGAGVPDANIKGRAMFVWFNISKKSGWPDLDRLFTHVLGAPKLPAGAPPDIVAGIEKCLKERPASDRLLPPDPDPNRKPLR